MSVIAERVRGRMANLRNAALAASELTVVSPVYCNASTLAELVARIHASLDRAGVEHIVLLIDDASPDGSWSIMRELCVRDRRLAAVRLARNAGQHRAILTGFALARSRWVAVLDADLQDPPEALPAMLARATSDGVTVFGERTGRHSHWARTLGSALYKSALASITGMPRRCGTFFVTPGTIANVASRTRVAHPHASILVFSASERVRTVHFERKRRAIGRSAYDLPKLAVAAQRGFRCALDMRRSGSRVESRVEWASIADRAGEPWQPSTL